MHTDLFLAPEKQDVQSGLYQPGRGRRSPCPQEIHSFLLQMLALIFMPGERKPFDSLKFSPAGPLSSCGFV